MDIAFRLTGGPTADGSIRALDAGRITTALHEVSIRLGRERVDMTRPGRSTRSVEELCEVRLVGLRHGSTVLGFEVGPADDPLDLAELEWQQSAMTPLFEGLARDVRPEGVSDEVADSVGALAQGLRSAASQVELRLGEAAPIHVVTAEIHRETWTSPYRALGEEVVTLVGVLEKVDLHSHEFRLRDDAGNTFDLRDVDEHLDASALLGRRISASGQRISKRGGRLAGLQSPTLEPYVVPLPGGGRQSLTTVLGAATPTSLPTSLELSDDEFASFMRAMGR